jgi:lipopolysaccharide export LptBFGC system permease protein LptF
MSDMNSLTMIFLAETSVILLVALIVVLWLHSRSKNKQRKAVEQLVFQIKKQSKSRSEETGSFLQEIYGLRDDDLTVAAKTIDKQERLLFQKLVDALSQSDASEITSLDTSVYVLVDAYKSLTPKPVETINNEGADDVGTLSAKNAALTEELRALRETISSMSSEFRNLFGGGPDNDLDSDDVMDKVATADAAPEGEETVGTLNEEDVSGATSNETEKKVDAP